MAMRAGGRILRPTRPKTLAHIERDLIKFISQKIQRPRRELRAAKQALVIVRHGVSGKYEE